MRRQVRSERLIVGLHGLALLRGWPLGDEATADEHLEAIRRTLEERPDPLDITDLDVAEGYAIWSERYDAWNPLIEAEEPAARGFLEELPPGRALDVACGTGRLAAVLLELGHSVVAMDSTPQMLERASAKAEAATFVRADFHRIPFAPSAFDVVVCNLALSHAPALRPVVEEIARALRPGGAAILSDIHPVAVATGGHALFVTGERSRSLVRNELHWPAEYVDAFNAAGLEIRGCAEPVFRSEFSDMAADEQLRRALHGGVSGLPFALVWSLRRS